MNATASICPKCGAYVLPEPHLLMSNPPQRSFICGASDCKHRWTERVQEVSPLEVTWAVPDHVKRAAERDEEKHALHVQFMHKQLATMDAEAAYRAVIQAHHIRQTEALEGILRFLRESREEDLNRSRVVMD